jgi:integrase
MGKDRRGWIVEREGKLYVRVSYTDNLGKERELMRRAKDRKHARQLQKDLVKQLDSAEHGNQRAEIDGQKLTFAKIADQYAEVRLIEAVYVGDIKVTGLRSLRTPKAYLKRLVEHFGNARIRSITYNQIDQYRLSLLAEGLTIASVNRHLALLRSVFNFCKREGYIARSPFEAGAPLINACDETRRDRVLSRDEEERLLLALSDDSPLAHIRPLVMASLDTGARKNELLTLCWSDVSIEDGAITLRSINCKTAKSRKLPISARLKDELQRIKNASESSQSEDSTDALVFNSRNLRRCWEKACELAGLTDFRWHDMRSSFCTRLIESGLSIERVAKLSGHTELETLYSHYLSTTEETIQKATDILNALNTGDSNKSEGEDTPNEFIN